MLGRFGIAPVEALIMASVVVMSLLGWASKSIRRALILTPYRVRKNGEVYRVLTGAWLHADVVHLAVNLITLHFFAGPAIETLGPVRFGVLYVTSAIVAFLPTVFAYSSNPRYGTLGARRARSRP